MRRILLEHGSIITIALIPLLYLAVNPSLGQNQAGDIDTWFYFGLAKSFWHHLGHDFYNDYFETRLPYIIPAAIIFALPSDRVASLILSYLVYCTCAFSLFYVLSRQVEKSTALLATMLMASDIFFMRTVSWQYVDGGVLAYGSLTFVALTAAAKSRHRYLLVVLSGFFYASMVIVHLGSAPLGLGIFGYAIFILDMRRMRWREFFTLVLCAALGALSCQVIYGSLNMYLYDYDPHFWFEREQIRAGMTAEREVTNLYWRPLDFVFATGWWLTIHIAVWFAAGAMIAAKFVKLCAPNRFQLYCMFAVFATYSMLFALDYFHFTLFLRREGLYISTFLFLSYLFVGSILPRANQFFAALIVAALFLASLIVRIEFSAELGTLLGLVAPWAVGLSLGVVVSAAGLMKRNAGGVVILTAAGVLLVLPITWPFRYEKSIYEARSVVAKIVGNTTPYFAFSDADPLYEPVITGLVGSFTPRALWMVCRIPNCYQRLIGTHTIIVPSSNSDAFQVADMVSSVEPKAMLSSAVKIRRPEADISIYSFLIPESPLLIPGPRLPSLVGSVEAGRRVATEKTNAGYLTYGPYAMLDPGRYEVTMKYEAEGEAGSWEVTSAGRVVDRGKTRDTRGAVEDIILTIDLPNGADDFQVRMYYSGGGRLAVVSLGIKPLNSSPAAN